jgi:hypothetical protein
MPSIPPRWTLQIELQKYGKITHSLFHSQSDLWSHSRPYLDHNTVFTVTKKNLLEHMRSHKSVQLGFVLVMPLITLGQAGQERNEKMLDL